MDINGVTCAINGAVSEVNLVLDLGFLEKVYENALLVELKRRGLKAEIKRMVLDLPEGRDT